MIDIHCHILPGIDDGARTIDDSIAMAKLAYQEGIRTIIATPHHQNGKYSNVKKDILAKVTELNKALEEAVVPVQILPGQETRIYGEMLEDYEQEEILTINNGNRYLFVEFPSAHVPRYAERLLFDIQLKGLVPIIVHPERNQEIIEHPELLYQLVKKGALTQVTAASVAGHFGKNIKKFSLQVIDANLAHFVSSDAHNVSTRSFKMVEALDEIEKRYGVDMVYYFTENAELLVEGQTVYKEVPEKIKKKKFLGVF
ncbi:tyrosine protein phosphatase [Bacillus canaveralius]|uniref:Tyrosine-protein phosphatase n=1 Tax=Bacillus canaveralius TaxID=1403243 RepID=A0A2N5GQB1_9BACI|nr:CpsB/CapC family capsule biosynthesis tyrosine phosphatase [Bacillus canaveralius]PLR85067.1 tyrosine protein phosphatase [Bacillus canaveralius]PLS00935.1 tyrosine protein phosphatase [Bacillus canaveralius]RSK54199.1 tyrosine protein phosphatase [Bacillus canaveralius]